jgi:hypothetical protein
MVNGGKANNNKNYFNFFFKNYNKNCTILDESAPTRKALIHSIPISEFKDMNNDVLQIVKAFKNK